MNYRCQQMIAFVLLILTLPLSGFLAVCCALWNGFPVFYRGKRQGLHKKIFTIWKFRTMDSDAPEPEPEPDLEQLCSKDPNDPRITRFGRILRRFSFDELPQLWNVLKGEMALVGPRPITSKEELLYGKYSSRLHSVKPGMTGLWQVSGRNLTTYRRRIALNRYYVAHRSARLDLWILYRTVGAVLGGRGAF